MKSDFIESLRKLKHETGVGLLDCKRSLRKANGDINKARQILREDGILDSIMDNRPDIHREGVLESYSRGNIACMLELNCEKAETANKESFLMTASKLCLHIVGFNPRYISRDDIPFSEIKLQEELYRKQNWKSTEEETKQKVDKMMETVYYPQICLVKQKFCDGEQTVKDMLLELGKDLDDNITIGRFLRWSIS
jgi:elongation factor Ts